MPRLPDTAWFELAPDWVCEILSPATARIDRVEKLPIYAAHGVQHAWLVDPDLRTLEVFEIRDGKWLLLRALANDAAVVNRRSTPSRLAWRTLGGLVTVALRRCPSTAVRRHHVQ